MKKENYNVAVVGATGVVGEEMRGVLEERLFPVGELHLLASERSAGQVLKFGKKKICVEILRENSFRDIDIALFSAGGAVSAKFAPMAVNQGAVAMMISVWAPLPETRPPPFFNQTGDLSLSISPPCNGIDRISYQA